MSSTRTAAGLGERLDALAVAVDRAQGRLEPAMTARAREVLARSGERTRLSLEHTVVVLAGATGSGKSSLFNALVGFNLSPTGVLRPTTGATHACVWGAGADPLLDWLQVPRLHRVTRESALAPVRDPELDGLVLLDLPDFDSTDVEHRLEVDRLVELADLFIWVLDPQKYADAALHEGYLRRLAPHAAVTLVALNQTDRLDDAGRAACLGDLQRLLQEDGLHAVPVVATSARTGAGVAELRARLGERVRERHAALDRLGADITAAVEDLAPACGEARTSGGGGERELAAALSEAAGVDAVADASAQSYRMAAVRRTGWPVTRWVARLRPDPLRRLHLGAGSGGRTSLPAATPVQRARVSNALRELSSRRAETLPAAWRGPIRAAGVRDEGSIADELDRAVRAADVVAPARLSWWSLLQLLQALLLVVAMAGGVWLLVLAVFSYLRLPDPFTPHIGRAPVPTVMLLGGIALGLLLALLAKPLVAVGARRHAAGVRKRLHAGVRDVAQRCVLGPLEAELTSYDEFCAAVRAARSAR